MTTTTNTNHTPEPPIRMYCISGLFIMGKRVSSNKILNPRVFTIIEVPEKNPITQTMERIPKMQLSPLPVNPSFITIESGDGFNYPISDTEVNLLNLYERVTNFKPSPVSNPLQPDEKVIKLV